MSIINDALKKAEQKQDLLKTETKKFVLRNWLIWTGAGVICVSGIILGLNYFKASANLAREPEQAASSKIELPESFFQLKEVDLQLPADDSQFKLTGILYDKQKPLAIINESIVSQGGFINEAQVLEISPDHVKISDQGEEVTLKIR